MKESKEFAEQFIEKLDKKELCPKPELDMNDEFVEEEIDKYNKLLDSGIIESATKDCRTCQNMSCRVENHEKPVEGCLGYINHDKNDTSSVRRILARRKK